MGADESKGIRSGVGAANQSSDAPELTKGIKKLTGAQCFQGRDISQVPLLCYTKPKKSTRVAKKGLHQFDTVEQNEKLEPFKGRHIAQVPVIRYTKNQQGSKKARKAIHRYKTESNEKELPNDADSHIDNMSKQHPQKSQSNHLDQRQNNQKLSKDKVQKPNQKQKGMSDQQESGVTSVGVLQPHIEPLIKKGHSDHSDRSNNIKVNDGNYGNTYSSFKRDGYIKEQTKKSSRSQYNSHNKESTLIPEKEVDEMLDTMISKCRSGCTLVINYSGVEKSALLIWDSVNRKPVYISNDRKISFEPNTGQLKSDIAAFSDKLKSNKMILLNNLNTQGMLERARSKDYEKYNPITNNNERHISKFLILSFPNNKFQNDKLYQVANNTHKLALEIKECLRKNTRVENYRDQALDATFTVKRGDANKFENKFDRKELTFNTNNREMFFNTKRKKGDGEVPRYPLFSDVPFFSRKKQKYQNSFRKSLEINESSIYKDQNIPEDRKANRNKFTQNNHVNLTPRNRLDQKDEVNFDAGLNDNEKSHFANIHERLLKIQDDIEKKKKSGLENLRRVRGKQRDLGKAKQMSELPFISDNYPGIKQKNRLDNHVRYDNALIFSNNNLNRASRLPGIPRQNENNRNYQSKTTSQKNGSKQNDEAFDSRGSNKLIELPSQSQFIEQIVNRYERNRVRRTKKTTIQPKIVNDQLVIEISDGKFTKVPQGCIYIGNKDEGMFVGFDRNVDEQCICFKNGQKAIAHRDGSYILINELDIVKGFRDKYYAVGVDGIINSGEPGCIPVIYDGNVYCSKPNKAEMRVYHKGMILVLRLDGKAKEMKSNQWLNGFFNSRYLVTPEGNYQEERIEKYESLKFSIDMLKNIESPERARYSLTKLYDSISGKSLFSRKSIAVNREEVLEFIKRFRKAVEIEKKDTKPKSVAHSTRRIEKKRQRLLAIDEVNKFVESLSSSDPHYEDKCRYALQMIGRIRERNLVKQRSTTKCGVFSIIQAGWGENPLKMVRVSLQLLCSQDNSVTLYSPSTGQKKRFTVSDAYYNNIPYSEAKADLLLVEAFSNLDYKVGNVYTDDAFAAGYLNLNFQLFNAAKIPKNISKEQSSQLFLNDLCKASDNNIPIYLGLSRNLTNYIMHNSDRNYKRKASDLITNVDEGLSHVKLAEDDKDRHAIILDDFKRFVTNGTKMVEFKLYSWGNANRFQMKESTFLRGSVFSNDPRNVYAFFVNVDNSVKFNCFKGADQYKVKPSNFKR